MRCRLCHPSHNHHTLLSYMTFCVCPGLLQGGRFAPGFRLVPGCVAMGGPLLHVTDTTPAYLCRPLVASGFRWLLPAARPDLLRFLGPRFPLGDAPDMYQGMDIQYHNARTCVRLSFVKKQSLIEIEKNTLLVGAVNYRGESHFSGGGYSCVSCAPPQEPNIFSIFISDCFSTKDSCAH